MNDVDSAWQITTTIELIKVLHQGQFDWTGEPYWQHPVAVMNLLPINSPLERKLLALLHDVVEDCRKIIGLLTAESTGSSKSASQETAFGFLKERGFSDHVLTGVKLLTRNNSEPYLDEIRKIIASGHLDAMWVKYMDNTHNTNKDRILRLSEERRLKVEKLGLVYEQSKILLRAGILAAGDTIPA